MEKEKAIEIFNKWMDCKDAYQADPSCDGNCFSCEYYTSAEEEKEAMQMAISALEKQEKIIEFIESRKQLHSSPAWYEFGIVKELDEVKRYVEKMQGEEES